MKRRISILYISAALLISACRGFLIQSPLSPTTSRALPLKAWGSNRDPKAVEEEARLKILDDRRGQIRSGLKGAESLRNFRIKNDYVPELDEDGKPIKSDGKAALTLTAFFVAAGAIALRVGGRAALISTLGLDMFTENQELQGQMNQILEVSNSMGLLEKGSLFCLAWTLVKVLCFDAGGVVLATASGILFGGVFQGAAASAFGATVGSSVAFGLAKLDTPVRKKALEAVEENPSLRGIEKVVAEDGFKAILTLRLAPVLPIPIGLYNYVYAVTNVPYFDFAGGVFLGSFKPYLLDSYLGYFGKSIIDGTAGDPGGMQDTLLLVVLGFSILIGVFASQLAGETWDAILEEEETEKKSYAEEEADDGIMRELFGLKFPEFLVKFQLALQMADERVDELILQEYDAGVWNYTNAKGDNPIPRELDPAFFSNSPEIVEAYNGIDVGASTCDGVVLSPALFKYFLIFANPLFDETEFNEGRTLNKKRRTERRAASTITEDGKLSDIEQRELLKVELLDTLQRIREKTARRLDTIDKRLESSNEL
mmetsp:Transcript_30037/g.45764  ORF Transcript_30037/g.45764 Transcript_30037/m.45764 type:complete len:541 (-) Transcript_30037:22-1644(-)